MKNKYPKGQIGLLLLVIIGVVVALVLSVASRSLSDTVLSRQERESSAAFSVAETGIETAMNSLRQGLPTDRVLFYDSTGLVTGEYQANLSTYALYVKEGESAHLDLSSYSPTLDIYWTKRGDVSEDITPCGAEGSGGSPAAIEVTAIIGANGPAIRSYYNSSRCSFGNGFDTSSDGGVTYLSKVTPYAVPLGTTMVRIKPLYAGATIAVSGTSDQMYLIQSKATGGDARKEIEVRRGLDAPASIFDFAVFTAGTIVK